MGISALPVGAQEAGQVVQQYLQSCGGKGQKATGNRPKISFQEGPCSGRAWKLALRMHFWV